MPCYRPIDAWRHAAGVTFQPTIDASPIKLPCGRCIGCRLERSRQWAVRLTHELRFHDESAFITLTYNKEKLPKDGSLDVKHFQDFMKRLRKCVYPQKVRFFHAGEYGERRGRPHYHAIIFGLSFVEKAYDLEKSDRGDTTWSSPQLDQLWPFGMNRVGAVTFESCAYVARYVTKKVTGSLAESHYERICEATGEVFRLKPEYATMSRRPGIGFQHFDRYMPEIYPADEVISRGHRAKPPKFYDKLLERYNPLVYAKVKEMRECALMLSPVGERSPQRLHAKEACKQAQIASLTRRYELG